MGDFNHKANFSNLPIQYDERIVVIIGLTPKKRYTGYMAPGYGFTPISVPIRGHYNDYGGIKDVDMTLGIEVLEKRFGMSVEDIVETAERISAGCERQIDYDKIKSLCLDIAGSGDLELSYIMEHEKVFDYLVSSVQGTVADKTYYRLPSEFLITLGYKGKIVEKPEYGMCTIRWEHEKYPVLMQTSSIWLENEFAENDIKKGIQTVKDLYQKIGCPMPECYGMPYFEYCFKKDMIKAGKDVILFNEASFTDKFRQFIDKAKAKFFANEDDAYIKSSNEQYFSFSRNCYPDYGLFHHSESTMYCDSLILATFNQDDHLDLQYMKECIEIAALIQSLQWHNLTWGETLYYGQDVDYDRHEKFMNVCIETLHDSKSKHD